MCKIPKGGGGVKALPKDLDHFTGFILLNSFKIVFNLEKCPRGGGVPKRLEQWGDGAMPVFRFF